MDEFDDLIDQELDNTENKRIKKLEEKVLNKVECYDLAEKILKMKEYKFRTMRNKDKTKDTQIYKAELGYYVPYGETYVHEWCSKNFRTSDKTVVDHVLFKINGMTYIERCDFIHPVNLINMKNGTFDLKTNKLLPHSDEYNFQGILDIPYNKNAKCPKWESALKGMIPDNEDRIRTQKWFGYQFIRENREQMAHGYFGKSGSGKSVILKILRDLLGEKNVTNFELQDFNNSNDYAVGRLYGKYANINYDMSTTPIKDISIFKKLTSGDPIKGRNIYESPFEFKNYAKLSWACNKLPIITDDILETKEFKRRIMLTEIVKGHEKDDKDIYYKFRDELSGIFNWAIEGHKLYFKEGGFKFNHDNVHFIWKTHMDGSNNDYDVINRSNADKYLYRIELERQETKLINQLKKVKEIIKDKDLESVLELSLKNIQDTLADVKKSMTTIYSDDEDDII